MSPATLPDEQLPPEVQAVKSGSYASYALTRTIRCPLDVDCDAGECIPDGEGGLKDETEENDQPNRGVVFRHIDCSLQQ